MRGLLLPERYARIQRNPTNLVARRTEFDLDDIRRQIDELPDELPDPCGYNLLILQFNPPKVTAGGIEKPDELLDKEKAAMDIGIVLALGGDAYQDPVRFPRGPWCGVNDIVGWRRYGGHARRLPSGHDILFLNDDQVICVFKRAASTASQDAPLIDAGYRAPGGVAQVAA
jgi:co-chaperonin GroES (HSP10)